MEDAISQAPSPALAASASRPCLAIHVGGDADIIFFSLAWHFAQGLRHFVALVSNADTASRLEIDRFVAVAAPLGAQVDIVDGSAMVGGAGQPLAFMLNPYELLFSEGGDLDVAIDKAQRLAAGQNGPTSKNGRAFMLRLPVQTYHRTEADDLSEWNPLLRMHHRGAKTPTKDVAFAALPGAEPGDAGDIGGAAAEIPTVDGAAVGIVLKSFPDRTFQAYCERIAPGGLQVDPATHRPGYEKKIRDSRQIVLDPLPRVSLSETGIAISDRGPTYPLLLRDKLTAEIRGLKFNASVIGLDVIPGRPPIYLRLGTSDVPTFLQVFVKNHYVFGLDYEPEFILDLGANIGLASAYFSSIYRGAHIVCVEPNSKNYEILQMNTASMPNVESVFGAVWSETTRLDLVESDSRGRDLGFWGSQTRPQRDTGLGGVQAYSVPDLIEKHNFPKIDMIKIDVEGAEFELFKADNCDAWLAKTNCVVVETHERFKPGSHAAVIDALGRHPFKMSEVGENLVFQRTGATI